MSSFSRSAVVDPVKKGPKMMVVLPAAAYLSAWANAGLGTTARKIPSSTAVSTAELRNISRSRILHSFLTRMGRLCRATMGRLCRATASTGDMARHVPRAPASPWVGASLEHGERGAIGKPSNRRCWREISRSAPGQGNGGPLRGARRSGAESLVPWRDPGAKTMAPRP